MASLPRIAHGSRAHGPPHSWPTISEEPKLNASCRHGWGLPADPTRAITYLSAAANNSAAVEAAALSSGMKKGGAAKGELVLALYELANCFRHGWGVARDPAAARSYYETAANLGDADAMAETARCYEEGFGGKKDKVRWTLFVFALSIPASSIGDGSCEMDSGCLCLARIACKAWKRT